MKDSHPDAAMRSDPSMAAAAGMARRGRERRPDPAAAARFERDWRVFLRMHEQRRELDAIA